MCNTDSIIGRYTLFAAGDWNEESTCFMCLRSKFCVKFRDIVNEKWKIVSIIFHCLICVEYFTISLDNNYFGFYESFKSYNYLNQFIVNMSFVSIDVDPDTFLVFRSDFCNATSVKISVRNVSTEKAAIFKVS